MHDTPEEPWEEKDARVAISANRPGSFIEQHVLPLLYENIRDGGNSCDSGTVLNERQFWRISGQLLLGDVHLSGYKLTDWFPRAPGVFWSTNASQARRSTWKDQRHFDDQLGHYYSPVSKQNLVEQGGIGTIRLRPRQINGELHWLATALQGHYCHGGIPLAIPDRLLIEKSVEWGSKVDVRGRARFIQDLEIQDLHLSVRQARPLLVLVEGLTIVEAPQAFDPIIITPVALFEASQNDVQRPPDSAHYTFIQCAAGSDDELDAAANWIETYVGRFSGQVITNYDQQRPTLADAPLSYQKLVDNCYDRSVLDQFAGSGLFEHINRASQINLQIGGKRVGHNINIGASGVVNVDSKLTNVTQTLGSAPGLDQGQRTELEALVQSLRRELDQLKATHADETEEIVNALERVVSNASKAPEERKQSLLQLSAKGLKDAAELVKDTAPGILATASSIAKFIEHLK